MTDQPRGAYTPQPDAPLQFDARRPAARRPMPMALIASGTLLVVLIAAVAMYYSRGVRGDNEPPRPVGEPVSVLKSAPAAGAQPTDAAAPDAAPAASAQGQAPVFAPAPEAPSARPAPAAPNRLTVQTLSAGDMNKAQAEAAPARTAAARPVAAVVSATPSPELPAPVAKTADLTVQTSTTRTSTVKIAAKPVAAKPVAAKVASAKMVSAKAAAPASQKPAVAGAASSGVRVQIGAFSSAALADKGYSDVATLMPGAMSGHVKHVEPVDKDGSTLYRTSVTGFGDRASAAAFCDALKAKGKICFVKS